MKITSRPAFPAALILALATTVAANARPIEFSEISLLVRAHESNPVILGGVRTRKLPHPLTASQENTLKAQGADDTLVSSLRDRDLALSSTEAATATAEAPPASSSRAATPERASESLGEQVRVFDLAYGHSINLSQWGGPSGFAASWTLCTRRSASIALTASTSNSSSPIAAPPLAPLLPPTRPPTSLPQTLSPANQRQGRTLHPNHHPRVRLCPFLSLQQPPRYLPSLLPS